MNIKQLEKILEDFKQTQEDINRRLKKLEDIETNKAKFLEWLDQNPSQTFAGKPPNCLHMNCSNCEGTGINKLNGSACFHLISCNCPRCTPYFTISG